MEKKVCKTCGESCIWDLCSHCEIKESFKAGDQSDSNRIICPSCGENWEATDVCESPHGWEEECGACGTFFVIEIEYSPTFYTKLCETAKEES